MGAKEYLGVPLKLQVLCLSVVSARLSVFVAKRCVLPKNCLKNQIGNGLLEIEWSRDR